MNAEELHKETILIVDDVPANVRVLYEFLAMNSFKVHVAKDGKSALSTVEHVSPDLILLDIMMPDMNGFEVCQALKAQQHTYDIPIIFMTALARIEDKVKGFSLGAVDYITKPFQHEEVLARITTHLSLRKLQNQLKEEINVRKDIEKSLHRRTVELERRNKELDAFARTVAHDLKNPLDCIVKFIALLLEECSPNTPLTAESLEYLRWIAKSGENMLNIIDALLLLAGASKRGIVNIAPLDMDLIVSQVIQQRLGQMLEKSHGRIKIPECWPVALGYAPWIEEVWANYLTNGLKYGGNPPLLELGGEIQEDGMIRFWVRDNGEGLSEEAQTRLFTPFTRLHPKSEGYGLGLAIVQQIIEKLNGQTGVECQLGKGCLFYFTLPPPIE